MEIIDNSVSPDVAPRVNTSYNFQFGKYIDEGFNLLKKEWLLMAFGTFVLGIIASIPLLSHVALAGFFGAARKLDSHEKLTFDDFFIGFKSEKIGQLILLGLVSGILIFVGFLFCVLPGLYLAVAYTFAAPFLLWATNDFWQAMEMSRKVVSAAWFEIFLFLIVVGLLSSLGVIACFVGIFFTLPLAYLSLYAAFKDITS